MSKKKIGFKLLSLALAGTFMPTIISSSCKTQEDKNKDKIIDSKDKKDIEQKKPGIDEKGNKTEEKDKTTPSSEGGNKTKPDEGKTNPDTGGSTTNPTDPSHKDDNTEPKHDEEKPTPIVPVDEAPKDLDALVKADYENVVSKINFSLINPTTGYINPNTFEVKPNERGTITNWGNAPLIKKDTKFLTSQDIRNMFIYIAAMV